MNRGSRPAGAIALGVAAGALAAGAAMAPAPARPMAAQGAREWVRAEVRPPSFDTGALYDPRGVAAAPGGALYVADAGHDRIAVVDDTGTILRAFGRRGNGPGRFDTPADVAVDVARDRVYVADLANRRLSVLTLAGTPVDQWMTAGPDVAFVPSSVAVAPGTGDVYVVSDVPHRVDRFGADGTWYGGWGGEGSGPGQLLGPQGIAVHPDGRVLVADFRNARLQAFSATGEFLVERPLLGIRDVAVSEDGARIYALHNAPGGFGDRDYVTVFAADLAVELETFAAASLPFEDSFRPAGSLAVTDAGRLALSTAFGPRRMHGVRQYAPQPGGSWSLAAATVADPLAFGGFLEPTGLATGPDGSLYLTEGTTDVTRHYAPDGAFRGILTNARGDELAVGPSGDLYLVSTTADVVLHKVAADGTPVWSKPCDCLSGIGVAVAGGRVFATSAMTRSLMAFEDGPAPDPLAAFPFPDPTYAWPLDVASGPDGLLYAAGGETGTIAVLDPATGNERRRWTVEGGGAERITVGPDGTVFALLFDGTIGAWTGAGAPVARWSVEPVPGAAVAMPGDLAAGPAGRLYVLDEATSAVLVYEARDVVATPTPPPTAEPPCVATTGKTALPGQVVLGQQVTLALELDLVCSGGRLPESDIVMVIDRSNSMAGENLAAAKSAALGFATAPQLDLGRNRLGLVSFSDIISLDQPLTTDVDAMTRAIEGVHYSGATELAGAMRTTWLHLAESGRPGAVPVVLLLTDGRPNRDGQPYVEAFIAAARARARGAIVYTIGLGTNIAADLLTQMAGSSTRFFAAPTAGELAPIYEELSETVGGVVARDVEIVDTLSDDVDYVAGSASDGGQAAGKDVRWTVGAINAGRVTRTLRVTPNRIGRIATNVQAVARYTADGVAYEAPFPVPEVEVVPVPTATPTPTMHYAYLPFLSNYYCERKDPLLGADVVMVLDTSSSMQGEKLAAAVAATRSFIRLTDSRRDWVGLVTFDGDARLLHPLTPNQALLEARLDTVTTGVGTRIDLGLQEAVRELGYRSREGSQRVIILLSDGYPSDGRDRAQAIAASAKQQGVVLFAIGLGDDVDRALLEGMASIASYFHSPTPAELDEIYRRLAREIPCR